LSWPKEKNLNLQQKKTLIVGASRGLGLGIVEVFVGTHALVTIIARGQSDLNSAKEKYGVETILGDATDPSLAQNTIHSLQPDVVIINAGAPPVMGPIHTMNWEDFSINWEADVKISFVWIQAILNAPLKANTNVLLVSSGASVNGSPLSGGYAGAKRTQWYLANYAQAISSDIGLDINFQTVLPMQMAPNTGVGNSGAKAYAAKAGVPMEKFYERFGEPLTPKFFGQKVLEVLENHTNTQARVFGITTGNSIQVLEPAGL
jgi:NADP-dependent 3-hydroxy acid dehydrogenase YdfG